MSEGAVSKKPFSCFYTQAEDNKVDFERVNKFYGKSNYQAYVPSKNNVSERIMESAWFKYQNKRLADKRRDEECRLMQQQWGQARGRMEAEI